MTRINIVKSLLPTAIILSLAAFSVTAFAEGPPHASEKPASGKPASEEPKTEVPAVMLERFDTYIGEWLRLPGVFGRSVSETQSDFSHQPIYGRATVVVFLASSCETCQEQMESIKRLDDRYSQLFTDFIYVFVSDSNKDALDFAKEFQISNRKLVHANDEVLKLFKNPRLPSIFIGDRHGWLAEYHMDASAKDISMIENHLKLMTAI